MRYLLYSCLIVFLFSLKTFAQVRSLPSSIDTNTVDPAQIPSPEKLKAMGATDEEVQKITEFKNRKLAERNTMNTTPLPNIPIVNSVVQKSIEPVDTVVKGNSVQNSETIYGHSFFTNKNIKFFDKANQAKAPDNYVLGVGDELNISIWGFSDFNEVFKIDENGAINPRLVGRIYLKGLTFKDAKGLIASKFRSVYDLNNSQIDVTLSYSKVITVNLVGEVNNPGSYTVPATNTAFNVLLTFGGVSPIGSVRKIYIRRGGQTIKTLDVYQYLMNPDSREDFFLENNDYILVPASGKVVKISGQVKRPMEYELTEKENLKLLVEYAGGFSAGAYRKRIQVKKYLNSQEMVVDVDYDSLVTLQKDFNLSAGDEVTVRKVPVGYNNYVELMGAVKLPGEYELKAGDRISDVLQRAEGVLYDVFDSRAYIIRVNTDLSKKYIPFNLKDVLDNPNSAYNITLQNLDKIQVFSKSYFKDEFNINVIGAVRSPGEYVYGEGITLKDALYLAGGLKKEAATNRIEVSRAVDFVESSGVLTPIRTVVKTIEVGNDLKLDKASENYGIEPYDQIFVRIDPNFQLQHNVVLMGEVVYPGTYPILNKNEKISNLIQRAGGLTPYAFPEGATLKRMEFNEGYVFFKLQDVLKDTNSKYNYVIKPGDSIEVARVDELIQISGAIDYPNIALLGQISAPFTKGKSARYYIKNYGLGFADNAAKRKTYVIETGGVAHYTKRFLFIKRYPKVPLGAAVVVPVKVPKESKRAKSSEPIDWNKAIDNSIARLSALATLYVIVTRILK